MWLTSSKHEFVFQKNKTFFFDFFLFRKMEAVREEHDAMGVVNVPESVLWGAQTQRAILHFRCLK